MRSFRQVHHLLETLTVPTRALAESGVAGADRIQREDVLRVKQEYERRVLRPYASFVSAELTGSIGNLSKTDFGDMDLLVHLRGENKTDAKTAFLAYLMSFPDTVFGPFKNPKYLHRREYHSGEIISVRYLYDHGAKSVQIDHMIALSQTEMNFKKRFLDFPAEKQGLLLGLVKVACMEEDPVAIFKRLNLRIPQTLEPGQEWEFNLNSEGLTLRRVTLNDQRKELAREEVWRSDNWAYVERLLAPYDLSLTFDALYELISRTLKHPRSKKRLVGVFKSMVTVKSGEVGTPKGEDKLRHLEKIAKLVDAGT